MQPIPRRYVIPVLVNMLALGGLYLWHSAPDHSVAAIAWRVLDVAAIGTYCHLLLNLIGMLYDR